MIHRGEVRWAGRPWGACRACGAGRAGSVGLAGSASSARVAAAVLIAGALFVPTVTAAQQDTIPGVRLGLIYESGYEPSVAVKPFTARFGGGSASGQVEAMIARDLRYSSRFQMLDSIPAALMGSGVDYSLWDRIGADWLIAGQVEGSGDGYVLLLELHDIVFGEVKERGRFPVPDPLSDDFRMAVHRISDQVVEWITGEHGMAASRIAFSMRSDRDPQVQELWVIDADGENLRRISRFGSISMSPAWSPDGTRLLYASFKDGNSRIYELDLVTGEDRQVRPNRGGQHYSPTYHPDGHTVTFSVADGRRSGLFSYNLTDGCCLTHLSGGRWNDISPSYSQDGRMVTFTSNRLGVSSPQIYVLDTDEGDADLVSPYAFGRSSYYTSPDWSPTSDRVAFSGRIGRSGSYQILVAELQDRGRRVIQLTAEGNNEDPSWAPDGRHIVFAGERSYGFGLFVVDAATGRIRPLVTGIRPRVPEWSGSLGPETARVLQGAPY